MKKIYLVSFLTTFDYPYIGEKFHSFAQLQENWWHYADSTYLLVSKEDIGTMTKLIRAALGKDGKFIVIRLRKNFEYSGWMPKQAWTWIKKVTNPTNKE